MWDAVGVGWGALEKYGWYLVAALVVAYVAWPYVQDAVTEQKRRASAQAARDPARVDSLRQGLQEVRERQMREAQERLAAADAEKLRKKRELEKAVLDADLGRPAPSSGAGPSAPATVGTPEVRFRLPTAPSTESRPDSGRNPLAPDSRRVFRFERKSCTTSR